MLERAWHIDTDDGHRIYGRTNSPASGSPDRAIVMVHGLTGNMNEYQNKTAAHFFAGRDFDVIRFNLYSDLLGGRRLSACTLQTHAADLHAVLASQCTDYRRLYLIGHSFGGPAIMVAHPKQARAISLWDPSFDLPTRWRIEDRPDIKRQGDVIYFDWGVETIIGAPMIAEASSRYGIEESLALSTALDVPIQVVHAGDHHYAAHEISWHSAGHPANERVIVPGADHGFKNGRVLDDVLAHSLRWFERFA